MKRLLTGKAFKIAIYIYVLFFSAFFVAHTQSQLGYYKGLFDSWGVKTDVLQSQIPVYSPDDTESKKGRAEYLLISESQQNKTLSPYKKVIVITDNPMFIGLSPKESTISEELLEAIKPSIVGGTLYYRIPKTLLVTPSYQNKIEEYFKSVERAGSIRFDLSAAPGVLEQIKSSFDHSLVSKASIYALAILVFIVVLLAPLRILVQDPAKFLDKSLYLGGLAFLLDFVKKNVNFIRLIFVALATFYIPILYLLSVKSRTITDPLYAIRFLGDTFIIKNVASYLDARSYFRLAFLFYNYALVIFGVALTLPSLNTLIRKSVTKISALKIRVGFMKWLPIYVVLANMVSLAFFGWRSLLEFLIFNSLVLLSSFLYLRRQKIEYAKLFSFRERFFVIVGLCLLVVLNVFYPLSRKGTSVKYSYESLIGVKDPVVLLPYSKEWKSKVLFKPFYYNGGSKIFVNGYLIYDPLAKAITNKPLTGFSSAGESNIVSDSSDEFIGTVLTKPDLVSYLKASTFSPFSFLDNSTGVLDSTLRAKIGINCKLDPSPAVVKLDIMSLDRFQTSQETSIETNTSEILDFPGCSDGLESEVFEVPIDFDDAAHSGLILRLRGIDSDYLSEFKLLSDTKELPLVFLTDNIITDKKYVLVHEGGTVSEESLVYSPSVKEVFTVDSEMTPDGVDLSKQINELMKKGLLGNPFIIWSDTENEVFKADL